MARPLRPLHGWKARSATVLATLALLGGGAVAVAGNASADEADPRYDVTISGTVSIRESSGVLCTTEFGETRNVEPYEAEEPDFTNYCATTTVKNYAGIQFWSEEQLTGEKEKLRIDVNSYLDRRYSKDGEYDSESQSFSLVPGTSSKSWTLNAYGATAIVDMTFEIVRV